MSEPGELGAAMVRASLAEARRVQARALGEGQTAVETAARLAETVTDLAQLLFIRAARGHPTPVALVALGSLGRRELAPHSDIDLALIAPEGGEGEGIGQLADRLFYPLWDAGLEVGHAVRSPAEFGALAREDDSARTAAIDWRSLGGDVALTAELDAVLTEALRGQHTARYIEASLSDWSQQHSPATIYRLEPDIKGGPGGWRELQRVWWAARLVWRIQAWPDLLARGLVDSHDFASLMGGREALLAIRLAMHFCAGRRQDQLRFDLQGDVAEMLAVHLRAAPGVRSRRPEDQLLEVLYRNAKAVRAVSTRILERCADDLAPGPAVARTRPLEGFVAMGPRLTVADPDQFAAAPVDLLRIFRVAQLHGLRLHTRVRTRIVEAAVHHLDEAVWAEPRAIRLFFDILGDPRGHGSTPGRVLEVMHELGVLERVLPELRAITGLVQRDAHHTYTVDAHLVFCAARVMALVAGSDADTPEPIRAVARRIARPHLLVLAALLHDVGKGLGHGHAERGALLVVTAAERFCLSPVDADDLVFLVGQHLEMFKISQRRDLEDVELIQRFAAEVETIERLNMLYLLSFADAVTTGPSVWSEWKGALLTELFQRTRQALARGAAGESLTARSRRRLEEIVAELGPQGEAMRRFATQLPARHIVSFRTAVLQRQALAVAAARTTGAAASIAPDALRGGWEVVVAGPDRPGLLADLTAVLAASGVSIDAAHISALVVPPGEIPVIVDTFVIRPGQCPWLEDMSRRESLETELILAVRGGADPSARLAERRRAAAVLPSGAPPPDVRVLFDLGADNATTVVDLYAPDRVGLLHDVATAIFAAGASIVLARVTTEGECATDAFYLVDTEKRAPLTPEQRGRVEVAIREAVVL